MGMGTDRLFRNIRWRLVGWTMLTVTVILVATTGECVLSLGWGLYRYRNAVIPLYVPFGHGIFYALAAECGVLPAYPALRVL